MRALALALAVLSLPVRASDVPRAAEVQRASVLLPSGEVREVEGGCWLREDVCMQRARELAQLRAENEALESDAGKVPLVVVVVLVVSGAALGFTVASVMR